MRAEECESHREGEKAKQIFPKSGTKNSRVYEIALCRCRWHVEVLSTSVAEEIQYIQEEKKMWHTQKKNIEKGKLDPFTTSHRKKLRKVRNDEF